MAYSLQHALEPAWPDLWTAVRDRLRLEFGQGIFDTWLGPLSLAGVEKGHVRLEAQGRLVRDYVASHHAARRERTVAAATHEFVSLDIVASSSDMRPGLS